MESLATNIVVQNIKFMVLLGYFRSINSSNLWA